MVEHATTKCSGSIHEKEKDGVRVSGVSDMVMSSIADSVRMEILKRDQLFGDA